MLANNRKNKNIIHILSSSIFQKNKNKLCKTKMELKNKVSIWG